MTAAIKHIRTATLDIGYEESGAAAGVPVLLMHGWPYDPRDYDDVVPPIADRCRVIVPYLRGFGATRFLSPQTPRSGQQAALGNDLRELMDALAIERAVLTGYDWGGRAACIVAALWPERAIGLVTGNSYNLQNIPASRKPASPSQEYPALVSILFSQRARPRRITGQSPRIVQTAVAIMVAVLGLRRRNLCPHRGFLRQSGFCRGDDPVIPASLRLCAGRSGAGIDRAAPCRPAPNWRSHHCPAGRSRRRPSARSLSRSRAVLHRTVRTPPVAEGWSQSAARSTASGGGCYPGPDRVGRYRSVNQYDECRYVCDRA